MVKKAEFRKKKYEANVDGPTIGSRIAAQKDAMVEQESEYLAQIALIEAKVKSICEEAGVSSYQVAQYINIGRQCYSIAKRFSGDTRDAEAQNVVDHWTSRGLNGELCARVCNVTGCKTAGEPPTPPVIKLDDLEDVEITDPETCDTLHYDKTSEKWSNQPGLILKQALLGNSYGVTLINNITNYLSMVGSATRLGSEFDRKQRVPLPGKLKGFYVKINVAPGLGKSWIFKVRINEADSGIVLVIADTDTEGEDTTHEATVSIKDDITIEATPVDLPLAPRAWWGCGFYPD